MRTGGLAHLRYARLIGKNGGNGQRRAAPATGRTEGPITGRLTWQS